MYIYCTFPFCRRRRAPYAWIDPIYIYIYISKYIHTYMLTLVARALALSAAAGARRGLRRLHIVLARRHEKVWE